MVASLLILPDNALNLSYVLYLFWAQIFLNTIIRKWLLGVGDFFPFIAFQFSGM